MIAHFKTAMASPLISSKSLETALDCAINYNTGFSKENIKDIDKPSYSRGVCTILGALFRRYDNDEKIKDKSPELISKIFSINGSKQALDSFLERISKDLDCEKFYYEKETVIEDMKRVEKTLKKNYSENDSIDFNSFMVGVKCAISPIKAFYDKITGKGLKNSNNVFSKIAGYAMQGLSLAGMRILGMEEKAKSLIEELANEINSIYFHYHC
ncbi:MAG: hypothetical protein PHT91_00520 [Candidatus Nanoarchaeia archaeon]|nr:hypothetical protein [Candidatus Nanoarchaeia archaeon]